MGSEVAFHTINLCPQNSFSIASPRLWEDLMLYARYMFISFLTTKTKRSDEKSLVFGNLWVLTLVIKSGLFH